MCLGAQVPSNQQKWPQTKDNNRKMQINPDGSYSFTIVDPNKEFRAEVGFYRRGESTLTVQGFFIIRLGDPAQWQLQIYQADASGTKILLCKFYLFYIYFFIS